MENCVICKEPLKTVIKLYNYTKSGNCEVRTCAPLQDSPFIRSSDTNIAKKKTLISHNFKTEISGSPEPPPTARVLRTSDSIFTLLNAVYFAAVESLLVYLTKEVSRIFQLKRLNFQQL